MTTYLRDGFPGQRLHVLPNPLVREASRRPPTSRLLVTDAGYFPHALRHGRVRRSGSAQTIVIVCVEGAGWCDLDSKPYDIRAGDVMVIPPRTPHRYYAHAVRPWSIWWLHVTGDDVADLLTAAGLTTESPIMPLADPVGVTGLIETVCDALAVDETAASLSAAAGAAWHLLALLAGQRHHPGGGTAPIALVQSHLRLHLDAPVSVPELAAMAGFSSSHFSARFRAVTGFSVVEYVKRLRMARARQLLITSELSVAEVATDVGYADPFYFSRQFRAVTGLSPRSYRQRSQEEAIPLD